MEESCQQGYADPPPDQQLIVVALLVVRCVPVHKLRFFTPFVFPAAVKHRDSPVVSNASRPAGAWLVQV